MGAVRDLFRRPCWDHRGATGSSFGVIHYEDRHTRNRRPWITRFRWRKNLHPWIGGDEWCRYTLVVPLIFTSLVIPLWACRDPECDMCKECCPGQYDWSKAIPSSVYFADDYHEPQEEETCHCGKAVHIYGDGFTRGLCEECSTVRCDVEPGACDERDRPCP